MKQDIIKKALDRANGDKPKYLWRITYLIESFERRETERLYDDLFDLLDDHMLDRDLTGFEFENIGEVDQ